MILVQGFCPLKVKIMQFPDGFRLKLFLMVPLSSSPNSRKLQGLSWGEGKTIVHKGLVLFLQLNLLDH